MGVSDLLLQCSQLGIFQFKQALQGFKAGDPACGINNRKVQ